MRFLPLALSFSILIPFTITTQAADVDLEERVAKTEGRSNGLRQRVEALEAALAVALRKIADLETRIGDVENNTVLTLDGKLSLEGTIALFSGVDVQVVNGLGQTTLTNGLGNLIVGYNDEPGLQKISCSPGLMLLGQLSITEELPIGLDCETIARIWNHDLQTERTGSHNLIVGDENNYTSVGGVVFGRGNTIGGRYATVTGGTGNVAGSGLSLGSHVSGGIQNSAPSFFASVSGGWENTATGLAASVSGGRKNIANAGLGSISGGFGNVATGFSFQTPSVTGGSNNEAVGCSSVSGGSRNFAQGDGADRDIGCSSVSGGSNNRATRLNDSVSGGRDNLAQGDHTSISGGAENIAGAVSPPQRASSILGGLQQTTTVDFETIPALP
jgi:hypothetical protein